MKMNKKVVGCFLAVVMLLAVSLASANAYTVKISVNKDTIDPEYQLSSIKDKMKIPPAPLPYVVYSFDSPGNSPTGLAWDGSYLWNADDGTGKIYKIDPSCGNVVKSYNAPESHPTGLAAYGNHLWNADYEKEMIHKLLVGTYKLWIVAFYGTSGDMPQGLAYNGNIYLADSGTDKIYKLDPDNGYVFKVFNSPSSEPTGLTTEGLSSRNLWSADSGTDKIYKMDTIDENIICSFDSPGSNPQGLAWDGTYLWNADSDTDKIYKIDVTNEPPTACYTWEDADGNGPGTVIDFDASCSTDDYGIVSYEWDWTSDGTYDETGMIISHDYYDTDNHDCTLRVTDTIGQTDTITITVWADVEGGGNRPPVAPDRPNGPTFGQSEESYTYSTSTIDPDDNNVYYWFDWGDGSNSGWIGPYASGETISRSHSWNEEGVYNVKAKAKDIHDEESSWSPSLEVTINKHILLTEGFEYGIMPPPGGWTVNNGNPNEPWKIVSKDEIPQAVYSGQYAAIIWFNSSRHSDNWLISPELDLTGCSGVELEFWMIADLSQTGATIELHIIGDGFDDVIWDLVEDENWINGTYQKRTFDLTSYKGEEVKIAWQYVGKNGPTVALDDITVTDPKNGGSNQQQNQQQQQLKSFKTDVGMSAVSTQKMFMKQLREVNK